MTMNCDLENSKGPIINTFPIQNPINFKQDNGMSIANRIPIQQEDDEVPETIMTSGNTNSQRRLQITNNNEEEKLSRPSSPPLSLKFNPRNLIPAKFIEATAREPSLSIKTLHPSSEFPPQSIHSIRNEEVKKIIESDGRLSEIPLASPEYNNDRSAEERQAQDNNLLNNTDNSSESNHFGSDAENGLSCERMIFITSSLHPHQDSSIKLCKNR